MRREVAAPVTGVIPGLADATEACSHAELPTGTVTARGKTVFDVAVKTGVGGVPCSYVSPNVSALTPLTGAEKVNVNVTMFEVENQDVVPPLVCPVPPVSVGVGGE